MLLEHFPEINHGNAERSGEIGGIVIEEWFVADLVMDLTQEIRIAGGMQNFPRGIQNLEHQFFHLQNHVVVVISARMVEIPQDVGLDGKEDRQAGLRKAKLSAGEILPERAVDPFAAFAAEIDP